ncbi:MAG: PEP-CTERM sorting domain-containing protein [Verrucomicrobia bacterium]|nr:PEP-CTERM sorting domain-containing protein [Verrucomicrobiota bacterium]
MDAAIVYSGPIDLTATGSTKIYFDLDQSSAGPDFASLSSFSGADFILGFGDSVSMAKPYVRNQSTGTVMTLSGYAARLNFGEEISSGNSWGNPFYMSYNAAGNWAGGADAYLGLRIADGQGNFNYGWAHVEYVAGSSMTLRSFAINSIANEPITAGATIPEPAALPLLIGGLAGAVAMAANKRRKDTVKSAEA